MLVDGRRHLPWERREGDSRAGMLGGQTLFSHQGRGQANARAGNHHPAWPLALLRWLLCTASLPSPCSLQHNTIKEDGATFLAEALLTNHRLMTLQ